ncbi:hypothetical protein [Actinoplanes auranticolor]|uniref:hypothetical protein n=1 Tax=Actinoplanes auranticolor TaxID=47988 RepID=UPI001BB34E2E|nr:hypothetical protein [Actinoplanes auranticolor]
MPARVDLVTPAEPDQGVPSTTRARLKAAALGVVGALLVPLPAAAAPAPCEQALRYAAQSGAQLMRIGTLDLGPAGRDDQPIKNVGVGDAKSALVAQSPINAAALGRVLDGGPADSTLGEVLQQTAPPTHKKSERRKHEATEAGPFRLGASELTVHAQWDPRMACGNVAGPATRAEAELRRAGVLDGGDAALVRVPGKISGLSTTAMERRGPAARAVAAASIAGGKVRLLGGAVTVEIVKPPSLLATMSGADGGEVRYQPAVLEVSGEGFETVRLDTAGDNVELRLDENGEPAPEPDGVPRNDAGQGGAADGHATLHRAGFNVAARRDPDHSKGDKPGKGHADDKRVHKGTSGKDAVREPDAPAGKPDANGGAATPDVSKDGSGKPGGGLFSGLPKVGALAPVAPLPLPSLPGVPPLAGTEPGPEAVPATGPGTTVAISLGDVRQAVSGHAIAAKATAMTIAITKGPDRQAYGDSAPNRSGAVLDLDMGLLEVAAVAPEPAGAASGVAGGDAGGLPITGPRVDVLALAGVALLIAGAAALIFGMRGRPGPRP